MLGIEDYGSDDESSRSGSPEPVQKRSTSRLPKPLPKATKSQRAPKKITIALPSLSAPSKDDLDREPGNDRPLKKQRTGAGVSSLLSMLPTPKESNPTPPTQRVLGGGSGRGLNFQTKSQTQSAESTSFQPTIDDASHGGDAPVQAEDSEPSPAPSTLFRPTSLAKGRRNISIEETNVYQVKPTQPVTTIQSTATSAPAPVPVPAPASDFFSFSSLGESFTLMCKAFKYLIFSRIFIEIGLEII